MDRQPGHDFTAASSAMAYNQQRPTGNMQPQQQFGFHPQHQQFPPPGGQGPPFLPVPPHPSPFQYPYHLPVQQQPQLPPHGPPHPHLLHLQQPPPAFPPHMAPPMVPSPYHGPYDSAPPPAAPPSDPELQKRIDKLVEYAAKNGPEFEAMIREKQQDNPAYSFLFGGEGHAYYRHKLWMSTHYSGGHFPPFTSASVPMMHHPPNPMVSPSSLNPVGAAGSSASMLGGPQMHQPHFPPFYDQQSHLPPQSFMGHGRPEYDQSTESFKGLSGPLPSDVAAELQNVLSNLTGTKESIKGAKIWFTQRSPFAPALAEALRDRVFSTDDSERQLHIIYLANDILFDSLQRRVNPHELDNEALAFKPILGSMLARIYHNPQNKEENQSRLQKILQFWASKEVYDQDTIYALEGEMIGGASTNAFPGPPKDLSAALADSSSGFPQQMQNQNLPHWQRDRQVSALPDKEHPDRQVSPFAAMPPLAAQQFLPSTVPGGAFASSIPSSVQSVSQPSASLLPTPAANVGEKLPPYPFFPPGLIPGMVRKMQIGSGVPYSPLSPLDIPNVIPPSNVSPAEILERVSKFFKEIGEVNPSEGPMKSDLRDEDDEYESQYDSREPPARKGGACIPPPPNLQVDAETGAYADGSVDRKSGSGRLGLGATADPNEVTQYDDVYTSYRKQRSTSYHSSMSARAAIR